MKYLCIFIPKETVIVKLLEERLYGFGLAIDFIIYINGITKATFNLAQTLKPTMMRIS